MFKLALRNLARQRLRTSLALGAIAFGVAGLILIGGFVEDIFHTLREGTIRSQLGHVQIYRAGYYEHGRRDPYRFAIDDPRAAVAAARRMPQVREAMRRLNFTGLLSNGRTDLPVIAEGVEPGPEARLATALKMIDGRALAAEDGNSLIVGEGVAAALGVAPGDYVNVTVVTPGGAMNLLEYEIVGVFRSISAEFDAHAVRLPLAAAQELLLTRAVHSVVLLLADTAATDAVASALRTRLGAGFEMKRWYELADFYKKTVDLYRRQFAVLEFITLVMVVLGVANVVSMTIHERAGEHGTMLAVGTRRARLFGIVMAEQAMLGLAGASLGVAVGIAAAQAVSAIGIPMPPPPNMAEGYVARILVEPPVVAIAFAIGWLATVFAALLPARRAARADIVVALRRNV